MKKRIVRTGLITALWAVNLCAAGEAALHNAAAAGNVAEVRRLLDAGANIEAKNDSGWTPLHRAAGQDNPEVVALLLDRGAGVEAKDNEGKTPLYVAAKSGKTEAVALLLNRGADINAQENDGYTPLHVAKSQEMVEFLLDHGADIEAKNKYGKTPLYSSYPDVVQCLLDHGANIFATTDSGCTPLHNAAEWGKTNVMAILLDYGLDIDVKDSRGRTPLSDALFRVNYENAKFLIDAGASITANHLKTAAGYASIGCKDITPLLSHPDAELRKESIKKRQLKKIKIGSIIDLLSLKIPVETDVLMNLSDALLEAESEKLPAYLLQNPGSEAILLVEVKKRLRDAQMEISKCKNRAQEFKEKAQDAEAAEQLDLSVAIQGYQASLLSIKSALENY